MREQAFMALPEKNAPRPAFTVRKLEGEVDHTVHIFDKKENRIKMKVVKEPAGYLVTFMKGHSIRCRDDKHLKRIGAGLRMVPMVDPESGEVKGSVPNDINLDAA